MRRKLIAVLLVLLFGLVLPACSFLYDEFFTLGKSAPDLAKVAQRNGSQ